MNPIVSVSSSYESTAQLLSKKSRNTGPQPFLTQSLPSASYRSLNFLNSSLHNRRTTTQGAHVEEHLDEQHVGHCQGCVLLAEYLIKKNESKTEKIKRLKAELASLKSQDDRRLSDLERERDQSLTRLKHVQFRYGRLVDTVRKYVPTERQSLVLSSGSIFYLRNGVRRQSCSPDDS